MSVGRAALQRELMLVQEKQAAMPQHLVLRTGQLVFRVYIDTFYSNQTILKFCENRIDD